MSKNYIKNLETGKIELHFEKSDYLALSDELKKEIKSSYLFSKYSNAWVSRGVNNQYRAIQTAKKLGFTEEEKIGERLSYEEQLERKQEKAEHRAERYDQYAINANNRGKTLQSELESHHGDNSFFTQPIISGHAGSQAFGNRRQRIYDRYHKGFEEYKKSEYFAEKAETARQTADASQLKDPIYLNNRIEECHKHIKKLEKNSILYEEIIQKKNNNEAISSFYESKTVEQIQDYLNEVIDKIEYQMDKLAFMQNCMDEIGGNKFSKENIKVGYIVNIKRWGKCEIVSAGPKNIQFKILTGGASGGILTDPYVAIAEILEAKEVEEVKAENPFKINDIVCKHRPADNSIYKAFQVVKITAKSVTIQSIKLEDHKPVLNNFVSDKQERKQVKKDREGNFVLNHDSWYLYKYTA